MVMNGYGNILVLYTCEIWGTYDRFTNTKEGNLLDHQRRSWLWVIFGGQLSRKISTGHRFLPVIRPWKN